MLWLLAYSWDRRRLPVVIDSILDITIIIHKYCILGYIVISIYIFPVPSVMLNTAESIRDGLSSRWLIRTNMIQHKDHLIIWRLRVQHLLCCYYRRLPGTVQYVKYKQDSSYIAKSHKAIYQQHSSKSDHSPEASTEMSVNTQDKYVTRRLLCIGTSLTFFLSRLIQKNRIITDVSIFSSYYTQKVVLLTELYIHSTRRKDI
jgi:hypothetical protein